ncbi:chemotaxis protein [Alkalicoccus daliensis]|uniref:Two-component system, chemotaxis family, response regulator CheV n=1 Tax=Alkalicoccus daliensis TaxID=745820 RepID=A0A1H0AEC5_9BACI|nr:chemotaxis protein [Alkalicoccus daliensis]SDN31972.1 two-component system, chemotaxis family, response regulator CheV [Alkalicoccus daliensis]
MKTDGILLESGTNELEVIVFKVGNGTFGINVMKVREIIQPVEVTKMPHSPKNVEGVIRLRDEIIPLINLSEALGFPPLEEHSADKLIVSELNQVKVAFRVHAVSRIHRISWEQIEKPNQLSQGLEELTIGVVKMQDNMVLLIDYEKIVYDIMPEAGLSLKKLDGSINIKRAEKKLLIAEDSRILRQLLEETLKEAGYSNLNFTSDGKEAWEYLNDSESSFDAIITDIEMPVMDGHHLTKIIKENEVYKSIPVIIFSSLITGDLFHKGETVGADAQISKPEIGQLVRKLDELTGL